MERYKNDLTTGLQYELIGEYYLVAGDDDSQESSAIGMWGQRHLRWLKKNRPVTYTNLLTSGILHSYLTDIDQQATDRMRLLMTQMAEAEGITEHLKASDQMAWVGAMNNIRARAEESIYAELIFN